MNPSILNFEKRCFPLFLLVSICILIYSNTFFVPWQFDDHPNILFDPKIQVEQGTVESFIGAFYIPSETGERLSRPISRLTFAINWFFHGDNVFGYHVVNLAIHILSSIILFFTIMNLFRTPRLRSVYPEERDARFFIAFLSATLWAIHPIQTQAVTYIVQRMASLSAFFYIAGILVYLKSRLSNDFYGKFFLLGLCLMCYILSVGSKENAIVFPLALFLLEIAFFKDMNDRAIRNRVIKASLLLLLLLFLISLFALNLLRDSDFSSLFRQYETRPFTLSERLLTQPRVVVFYLYQIIYPVLDNYSLMHDFSISTSLLTPWTTMPAILFIFLLIALCFYGINLYPLLAFSVLFYFLNHLIESSFIPLEMVFEHRNYLPSMFLFLPVSVGAWRLSKKLKNRSFVYLFLILSFSFFILIVGIATYQRNAVWATEASLWMDTYQKAPNLSRPAHNLAQIYMESSMYPQAMALNRQALDGMHMREDQKALTFFNIGVIYHRIGDLQKAIENYRRTIEIKPDHGKARYNISMFFAKKGHWIQALENSEKLKFYYPMNINYLILNGAILLGMERIDSAIEIFEKALSIEYDHDKALFYLGVAHHLSGNYRKADFFLDRATKSSSKNLNAWLFLIENRIRLMDVGKVEKDVEILFHRFDLIDIQKALATPGVEFIQSFSFSPSLHSLLGGFLQEKASAFIWGKSRRGRDME